MDFGSGSVQKNRVLIRSSEKMCSTCFTHVLLLDSSSNPRAHTKKHRNFGHHRNGVVSMTTSQKFRATILGKPQKNVFFSGLATKGGGVTFLKLFYFASNLK